jgi:hypothetical protein
MRAAEANEFLKEHKKVEELEASVASLAAAVKEKTAQIQKVSAQLELNKPAPRTVVIESVARPCGPSNLRNAPQACGYSKQPARFTRVAAFV